MGLPAALHDVYGQTHVQACWVHETANGLNAMPKSAPPKAWAQIKGICPLKH